MLTIEEYGKMCHMGNKLKKKMTHGRDTQQEPLVYVKKSLEYLELDFHFHFVSQNWPYIKT